MLNQKFMSKEIIIKENYSLDKVKDITSMSVVLKDHIVKHKLYTSISNKNYVHVEGWTFAGGLLGLLPIVKEVQDLSKTGEIKYMATVEIMRGEQVVGRGFAVCSNKENKKKSFDEYAVLSMAQTRAIGKAYRNLIGYVMKLAGYEGTPSEEMTKVGETPRVPVDAVPGPEGEPVVVCSKCDGIIDEQVAKFSKRVYGKKLCRDCQPKKK